VCEAKLSSQVANLRVEILIPDNGCYHADCNDHGHCKGGDRRDPPLQSSDSSNHPDGDCSDRQQDFGGRVRPFHGTGQGIEIAHGPIAPPIAMLAPAVKTLGRCGRRGPRATYRDRYSITFASDSACTPGVTEQTRAPVPSMHTCDAHVSHSELCTIEHDRRNANSAGRWSDVPAGTMDEASPFRVLMPAVSLTARTSR
jgi:hypothetical protein